MNAVIACDPGFRGSEAARRWLETHIARFEGVAFSRECRWVDDVIERARDSWSADTTAARTPRFLATAPESLIDVASDPDAARLGRAPFVLLVLPGATAAIERHALQLGAVVLRFDDDGYQTSRALVVEARSRRSAEERLQALVDEMDRLRREGDPDFPEETETLAEMREPGEVLREIMRRLLYWARFDLGVVPSEEERAKLRESQRQQEILRTILAPRDGHTRIVKAKAETWSLTFWRDGRGEGDDAVSIEVERHGHNLPPTLNAAEAAALARVLGELLPGRRPG